MKKGKLERKRDKLYLDRFRGLDQDGVKRLIALDAELDHTDDLRKEDVAERIRTRFMKADIPFTKERVLCYGFEWEARGWCPDEWYSIVRDCFGDPRPLRNLIFRRRSADSLKHYFPDCTKEEIRRIGYRQLGGDAAMSNPNVLDSALDAFVECGDQKVIRKIRQRAVEMGEMKLAERAASVSGKPLTYKEAMCIGRKLIDRGFWYEEHVDFIKRHRLRELEKPFIDHLPAHAGFWSMERIAEAFGRRLTKKQLRSYLEQDSRPYDHTEERVRAVEMLAARSPKRWGGEVMKAVRFARDVWVNRMLITKAEPYAIRCGVPITIENLQRCIGERGRDPAYAEETCYAREMLAKLVSEKLGCPPPPAPKLAKVRPLKAVA